MLSDVNKIFVFKSLLTMPSNVLPLHIKQTFPPIIWIFTEGEGDGIQSRLPLKIFFTLAKVQIILKDFWSPRILPKNEQTNFFLLLRRILSFVLCENSKIPKSPFEIIWQSLAMTDVQPSTSVASGSEKLLDR